LPKTLITTHQKDQLGYQQDDSQLPTVQA